MRLVHRVRTVRPRMTSGVQLADSHPNLRPRVLGVDVGGTFTDAVLLGPAGAWTAKAPTTPDDQSQGVIEAIELVLERAGAGPARRRRLRARNDDRHQRAARAARGADGAGRDRGLHRPARDRPPGSRPPLPALRRPAGAAGAARAADRRSRADRTDGHRHRAHRRGMRARSSSGVGELDCESVAICLLFSYAEPSHERRLAEAIRSAHPQLHVSVSSEVLPRFREYERCSTTVIDAYLAPLLARYLDRLGERCAELGLPEPHVMQSSGGIAALARGDPRRRLERPLRPGGRRRRRRRPRPRRRARRSRSASTWAAPPATSARSPTAPSAAAPDSRSPAGRCTCRWSTCTRSAPAAARSAGATPAARCGSGRARRAPSRARPPTAAAAASRP